LSNIEKSISIAGENQVQDRIYQIAYKQGLIGDFPESCPKMVKTAFNTIYEDSLILNPGEAKYVKNCGNCGITIEAIISKGYKCKRCGGEYKGC
jgi:Zn finger protein HypA/HybF involved in hydrogenase expression